MARTFLTAEWRDILMLNYELPAQLLHAYVPPGTELDTFEGRTLVSLVGFRFLRTCVYGLPIPGHGAFEEVNLRFYVRGVHERSRRGVVFVKEIVPRRAVTWVSRALFDENYHTHPMSHAIEESADEPFVPFLAVPPRSAFLASGSAVRVGSPSRLAPAASR